MKAQGVKFKEIKKHAKQLKEERNKMNADEDDNQALSERESFL